MTDPNHPWLHIDGSPIEASRWSTAMTVHKYAAETVRQVQHDLLGGVEPTHADFLLHGVTADDVAHEPGNLMTTAGLNLLGSLLIGGAGTTFTNAHAIVGVGSSSTAATVADAALGGNGSTTTAYYQAADATYPSQTNGVITCYSTFASGNANFSWNEWCFADGTGTITPGGTLASVGTGVIMINHKIATLGTKVAGAVWVAQGVITES